MRCRDGAQNKQLKIGAMLQRAVYFNGMVEAVWLRSYWPNNEQSALDPQVSGGCVDQLQLRSVTAQMSGVLLTFDSVRFVNRDYHVRPANS